MINQKSRCLEIEKHSKKNKTLGLNFLFQIEHEEAKEWLFFPSVMRVIQNYTHSTGDGLMGVQLLSTTLDTKSETISLLKKLSRWLNWHQETRGFFFSVVLI